MADVLVSCDMKDCCNNKDGYCIALSIEICDLECSDYRCYLDLPEYQEKYYTANERREGIDDIPDRYFRLEKKGKKVEWNGYTFFTNDYILFDNLEDKRFTEQKTGYALSLYEIQHDPCKYEIFVNKVKDAPDVMNLPLYEHDKHGSFKKCAEEAS